MIKKLLRKRPKTFFITLIIAFVVIIEMGGYWAMRGLNSIGFWPADPTFHPFLGWRPPANANMKLSGNCAYWDNINYHVIKTDEQGHPITPLNFENLDIRVVITGGGSIMGVGALNNSKTIPGQIEDLIYKQFHMKAEVVNLAVGGYSSFQEMLILAEYLVDHKADLIISLTGVNDYLNALDSPSLKYSLMSSAVYEKVNKINEGISLLNFLQMKFYSVNFLVSVLPHAYQRFRDFFSIKSGLVELADEEDKSVKEKIFQELSRRVQITSTNLSLMKILAEKNSAQFVAILLPQAFEKDSLTEGELKCTGDRITDNGRKKTGYFTMQYGLKYHEELSNIPKDYNFVNLRHLFKSNKDRVFIDINNYSVPAIDSLSKTIFENVSPYIDKRKIARQSTL